MYYNFLKNQGYEIVENGVISELPKRSTAKAKGNDELLYGLELAILCGTWPGSSSCEQGPSGTQLPV